MCSQPTAPKENQMEKNMKKHTREVTSKELYSRANRIQSLNDYSKR